MMGDLQGEQCLLVVDCNAMLHALFALQGDDIPDRLDMFMNKLERLWEEMPTVVNKPVVCVAVFDSGRLTFRHWISPLYKAGREKKEGIRELIEAAMEAVELSDHWSLAKAPFPFEGDDVMATLAKAWPGQVIIQSIDKDLVQCLEDGRVTILRKCPIDPDTKVMDREWLSWNIFKDKNGFTPDRFLDYQCLTGDSVDGISGCPGIGPVAAKALLAACDDPLEDWVVSDLEEAQVITGAKLEALEAFLDDDLYMHRGLTTLVSDIPVNLGG